jgi:dephospho-CoA kinase
LFPCIAIYFIGTKFKGVRIFGLTGGIACGKSTLVKQMTENLAISLIDCDQITRDISNKGQSGYNVILSMLGDKKD